ncbi:MAG: pyridoxamine kinase [Veillonellaceae bacterium]|nr:pyridoxamine kinase [Veillonellaceae bacterium]
MTPFRIKKVAAIHDLSCIGRCSLTVILPILSCLGIQACPLPTAVLSTHPGGFTGVSVYDFAQHIPDFSAHWRREGIEFDAIYCGFLASERQISLVAQFIDDFSANHPRILVDPVMGDDGRLYSICTDAMKGKIRALVEKAGIITPNYTEACFLLDEPWQCEITAADEIQPWLRRLAAMGPTQIVITGIPLPGHKIANLGFDRPTGQSWQFITDYIPVKYPGTGDAFASVLLGKLLAGLSLCEAIRAAGDFVAAAVRLSAASGMPTREGILLESCLGRLCSGQTTWKSLEDIGHA